jgi:hypothetical protein
VTGWQAVGEWLLNIFPSLLLNTRRRAATSNEMPPADDFRSDDELARAHQRGDAAAAAELVRRYEGRLRAFVCGDPRWAPQADDLLGQTWAHALRAVREGKFRGGPFRAWLFKVAEAVADRRPPGGRSDRAVRLTTCLARLRDAKPTWYKLVVWVSHGLNRTAVARRLRMTKGGLKRRYKGAVAAVRACLNRHSAKTADPPGGAAA